MKISDQKEEKSQQIGGTIATNRKCPKRGETADNYDDYETNQLINEFKELLTDDLQGTLTNYDEKNFQEISLIWYFKKKIDELLSVDVRQFSGNSLNKLEARLANHRSKWAQLNIFNKIKDPVLLLCALYKYVEKILLETYEFAEIGNDWLRYIQKNRLLEQITYWTISQLINALNKLSEKFNDLNISASTLKAILAQVLTVKTSAYSNPESAVHLCTLIKLHDFMAPISAKNANKINEKLVKRWRGLEECMEADEQHRTLGQFMRGEQMAKWLEQSLDTVKTKKPKILRDLMLVPGVKTRLAQQIGDRQRTEQMLAPGGPLKHIYTEKDGKKSFTLGTDLLVFGRWLKRKCAKADQLEIWAKLRNFVLNELYDPVFEMDEMKQIRQVIPELGGAFEGSKDEPNNGQSIQLEEDKVPNSAERQNVQEEVVDKMPKMAQRQIEQHGKKDAKEDKVPNNDERQNVSEEKMPKTGEHQTKECEYKMPNFCQLNGDKLPEDKMPKTGEHQNKECEYKMPNFFQLDGDQLLDEDKMPNMGQLLNEQIGKEVEGKDKMPNLGQRMHQTMAKTHFACPTADEVLWEEMQQNDTNAIDEIASSLLYAYFTFLDASDEAEIYSMEGDGTKVLYIEMLGVVWWLGLVCEELVKLSSTLASQSPEFGTFISEATKLGHHWNELLKLLQKTSIHEQKMFILYKFVRLLYCNETMRTESEKWTAQFMNAPFIHFLVEEFEKGICDDHQQLGNWDIPKFDKMEAMQIYESIMAQRERGKTINLYCIGMLIERFIKMRIFFCKMNTVRLLQSKKKIITLIGETGLVQLELMYPEVTKFLMPIPLLQSVRYKMFLEVPTYSDRSMLVGIRLLIIPLLFRHAQNICSSNLKFVDHHILEAFEWKIINLATIAYLNLRNGQDEELMPFFCLLYKFVKYMEKAMNLYKLDSRAIKVKAINSWEDCKCLKDKNEWKKAYQQQIDFLSIYHYKDMKTIIEENVAGFVDFMVSNRGVRSRAAKLLTEKHRSLLQINHSKLADNGVFSDAQLLIDYSGALFDDGTTMSHVIGTLSAQLSVWIRWMDSELMETQNSKRAIGHRKVWEKIGVNARLEFEDIYDSIEDSDLNELEQLGFFLRELIPKAKEFVCKKRPPIFFKAKKQHQQPNKNVQKCEPETKQTDHRHSLIVAEWDQMVANAKENGTEMRLVEETEGEKLIKQTHMDALIGLIKNSIGREILREGFDANEEAKERLINFIQFELIEDFMTILYSTDQKDFDENNKKLKDKLQREKDKKKQREADLADQNMEQLISEEERVKKLGQKMAERQTEKRKRRRESEQKRKLERQRRRGSQNSDETSKEEIATMALFVPSSHGTLIDQSSDEALFDSPSRYDESPNPSPSRHSDSPSWNSSENMMFSPLRPKVSMNLKISMSNSPRTWSNSVQSPSSKEKWRNKILADEIRTELSILPKFISDEFLHFAYAQFLTNPTEIQRRILDIGIFVNEILHRRKIVAKINKIMKIKMVNEEKSFKFKQLKEMDTLFMEEQLNETKISAIKTEGDFEKFAHFLHGILKRIIFEMEGKNIGIKLDEDDEEVEEMKMVRKQLHRNKLAQAIEIGTPHGPKSVKSIWQNMDKKQQGNMLAQLTGTSKQNLADRFIEYYLNGWRALGEQQRIDRKLYKQYKDAFMDKYKTSLGSNFPQNTQQIYLKNSEDEKHEEFLVNLLRENGFHEAQSTESASALNTLRSLISAWSNDNARVLETGSQLLGARTSNADIDIICVMRQTLATQTEEIDTFFGKNYCNLNGRICEDNSLYCLLCKHPKVTFLNKTPRGYIPMIELNFFGIDFDLALVLIPNIEAIPDEPLDATDIKSMMEIMAFSSNPHEGMLKSLSGYLANVQILELMRTKSNIKKFRTVLRSLNFWAKSNYIYGNFLGFFNGAALSILAAKIILWYPNCSVPFMFEKLMFILMNRKWPMPIQLTEEQENNGFESMCWNSSNKRTALLMPIITPSCLTQNASQNVNKSTFRIIQNTIRETYIKLKYLHESPINSSKNEQNWWRKLFPVKKFTSKYPHFCIIICMVSVSQHIDQFCRYIERKLRFQLENFDGILGQFIEYSHLNPNSQIANDKNCPKMKALKNTQNHFPICQKWLIGLKMKKKKKKQQNSGRLDTEKINLINELLDKEVATHIHKEYTLKVLKGMYINVGIESRYISAEELATEWQFEQDDRNGRMTEK
ncbi:hypothetical protein niasHT_035038 [Heterodera trifolii]|uniref:polynucleotide adenylyltransferase n=1 Tax=Heterodera trifolii TaxID=157864 RepID=A0ABD2IZP1_9BILA